MKKLFTSHYPLFIFFFVFVLFILPVFQGKIPVPADTILGMYHPWRDKIWDGLARVPFKNFLITDPVRQQYPWKELAIDSLKERQIPFWNPYTFSGTPLLANFQSAPFYPLNFLFFFLPFKIGWTVFIVLQQVLGGLFLFLYLRHFRLKKPACLLGCLAWVFSGFFISWWEWGNIGHTVLWLPLILLSVEKILAGKKNWGLVFLFSLCAQFLAGHLQISFYVLLISVLYIIARLTRVKSGRRRRSSSFLVLYGLFFVLTSVQWLPTFKFIRHSARSFDQVDFANEGWFLPWENLIQFFVPDFFGNPTTLNYWGKWNYAEFVGYVGIIPLFFSFLAISWRRDKKTLFFSFLISLSLVFALPTPLAKLPYRFKIPFISTSQPTRLTLVVDFALAVLAALGLDWLLKTALAEKSVSPRAVWRVGSVIFLVGLVLGGTWVFVFSAPRFWSQASWRDNLLVSKRNLILPTVLFFALGAVLVIFFLSLKIKRRKKFLLVAAYCLLFAVSAFDLLRFARKFTPFVKSGWLFPTTETTDFLKDDPDVFRFMTTDRRIFPPNFSVLYKLQTVSGYDPLYLARYAELVAALERGEPDISPPFGFNRIITPHNFESKIIDLLNVKYVLSLTDLESEKLSLVFREGETRVYENEEVFPRAFVVYDYQVAQNKQEAIDLLMNEKTDLLKTVILEETPVGFDSFKSEVETRTGEVEIEKYEENQVVVGIEVPRPGILVLADSYYPGWRAELDGEEARIYRADYNFRGIIVPEGCHRAVFKYGWP